MVVVDASDRTGAGDDRFGWVDALRTLGRACAVVGLAAAEARPMRLGENAIICLGARSVVVRIARTVDYLPDVTKEVAVARWFASIDFPAARLLPDVDQPLVIDGRVVTFWRQMGTGAEHGNITDLAVILRRLHHLAVPPGLELPGFRPFRRTRRRLANARVSADDCAFLLDRITDLTRRYDALDFVLPPGPVHGDADTSNLLRDERGNAALIDFEAFAFGHPEWDLVITAMGADSYGWISKGEYYRFAETYGFDVLSWDGYEVLRDIQEVMMVSWISQNVDEDARVAVEYRKRMESLRSGHGREQWSAF